MKTEIQTTKAGQKESGTQYVTSRMIKFLFAKFYARYGSKWAAQYPKEIYLLAQKEWLEMLGKCTPGDIRRGLENWTNDWPPNVMEFAKACKPPAETPALPMYREWKTPRLLPRVDKETAKANLAKLRQILNGAVK